ncbi:MAG: NAD(P)-dependent alcohol dehydrogenase [Erythrobacter sp.]
MKAWQIGKRQGIDGLRQVERDHPVPGPGEIALDVIAAALNHRDLMVLRGKYGSDLPGTRIPLSDGVGWVAALGEGVDGLEEGHRVIAPNFTGWLDNGGYGFHVFEHDLGVTADGWLAERIVIPAAAAIKVPDSVSDDSAASLAVVGATVWHAMVAFGQAGKGDLVLAQGTGGVSLFALQLAKALGATFAITSSSDEKLERARELGADHTVNYRDNPDWAETMLRSTGGRGADVVVDTLGFDSFGQTIAATAVEGRIGTIGALSGSPRDRPDFDQGSLIAKNIAVKGIASGHRGMLASALDLVAQHGIELVVDRTFAFDDAPAALEYLDRGAHMGKVLIDVAR